MRTKVKNKEQEYSSRHVFYRLSPSEANCKRNERGREWARGISASSSFHCPLQVQAGMVGRKCRKCSGQPKQIFSQNTETETVISAEIAKNTEFLAGIGLFGQIVSVKMYYFGRKALFRPNKCFGILLLVLKTEMTRNDIRLSTS